MHRNILILLSLVLFVNLAGCTSEESMLKSSALKVGQAKFEESLRKEAEESLSQSDWLRQSYIEFMRSHSEVEVEDLQFQGDKLAVASVVVKTYPVKFRRTLLGIAAKVETSKSRRFNFSEALGLVAQQTGQEAEIVKQPLNVQKFSKASNVWRPQD